jgi:hypothetical protein
MTTTAETLLDRIQIEDLLYNYYALLGRNGDNYDDFFTEDCVLDINGRVFKGRANIHSAYAPSEGAIPLTGKFHMLLNNPRITVKGDTATADMIWTGILQDNVRMAPRLVEQGREHDELVKKNGRWLFKHRVITADSGLPPIYDATYKKR